MSEYINYIKISNRAICDAVMTFDQARAAEKMMGWEYIGEANSAWKEGPYLSAGANQKEIDRTHPYCMRTSVYMRAIAGIVMENKFDESGKTLIPTSKLESYQSKVEPIIAKLIMIEQFEIFKDLMKSCDGPYSKKQAEKWVGKLPEEILDKIAELTKRRNELTHDIDHDLPTMKEAVEFFYSLRVIVTDHFNSYL